MANSLHLRKPSEPGRLLSLKRSVCTVVCERPPRPLLSKVASQHFLEVASTPPLQGGEYASPVKIFCKVLSSSPETGRPAATLRRGVRLSNQYPDRRWQAYVPPGIIEIRRSVLSWPTPFEINFMTGHSPSWKRHLYYKLRWKKTTGATLDMIWRYEQFFYGQQLIPGNGGWGSGFMTREGSTGLIQVTIKE